MGSGNLYYEYYLSELSRRATPLHVLGTIFGVLVGRVVWSIVSTRYFHPLSQFPGPFWASVSRLWITKTVLTGKEPEILWDLHKKYGPVIRISPNLLMCSEPKMLPIIYHSHADKADHYVTGSFGKTASVFNIQPHKVHAAARKKITQPYSFTAIRPMEVLIDNRIREWIDKLSTDFAETGKKLEFASWTQYFAYDVISEIAFGEVIGFVKNGYDLNGLISSFHEGLPLFGIMARLHPVTKWIRDTWFAEKYMIPKPEDKTGLGPLMKFRDDLIEARVKENRDPNRKPRFDMLQNFLDARDVDGSPIDLEDLKAETLLVLMAGSDTTATEFQGLMIYVLSTPGVFEKLMDELEENLKAQNLSPVVTYDEAIEHCPYYVACVKETLRLCPAAPNMFPRNVSKGGLNLYGRFAPEGTEVTCNPWITHRNKEVYGEDAEVFRPERWLEDPERAATWEKHVFVFGYGSRQCLGKNIALMELYKAPLQFFRTFRPELTDKEHPATYINAGGIARHKDLWLNIKRRT